MYFNKLGCAYYNLENYKLAIDSFIKATNLDPINAEYFYNLGCARYISGDYKSSIEDFFRAVYYSENFSNMSRVNKLFNKYLPASEKQKMIRDLIIPLNEDFIKNGIVVDWSEMNIVNAKGMELVSVGEMNIKESLIKLYLECATDEALGKVCLLARNKCFTQKEQAELYYQIGNQYVLKGGYAKAWEMYNNSILLNPNFLDVYVQAKIFCEELGEDVAREFYTYHKKASSLFELVVNILEESVPDSVSQVVGLTNIIQGYLFDLSCIEMVNGFLTPDDS